LRGSSLPFGGLRVFVVGFGALTFGQLLACVAACVDVPIAPASAVRTSRRSAPRLIG